MSERARDPLRALWAEGRTLARITRREGWKAALRRRLQHHSGALDAHTALAEVRFRVTALERDVAGLAEARPALEARAAALERHAATVDGDRPRVDHRLAVLDDGVAVLADATREARLLALVTATEAVLAVDPAGHDTLVTVILPTLDRPALLARAIASVQAQTHARWELLVVDNGGSPATAEAVERAGDPRVRLLKTGEAGACRARNLGLREARGALVSYLDDDNVMAPSWLRAVEVTALRHPERQAFYGARVDDRPPAAPRLVLEEVSAQVLLARNVVDTGALAHRASAAVHWPPAALGLPDWEVVAALVAGGQMPLAIPARALIYTTTAAGRTSADGAPARFAHSRRVVADILSGVPTGPAGTIAP